MTHQFSPAPEDLFFKSQKMGDYRFGQQVKSTKTVAGLNDAIIIAGYPDDEGISKNKGRLGAAKAPDEIRRFFYKTTPSLNFAPSQNIVDRGNLIKTESLLDDHESIKLEVQKALQQNNRWIGLGGGHDFGYPDGAGFLLANQDSRQKPLVLNFDSHLDVRPMDNGPSSGTPFYRLLNDKTLPEFEMIEIGIQNQCNSAEHLRWCREKNVQIISFEEIMMSGQPQFVFLMERLSELFLRPRPTFVSIDIDGFASPYAMGCSQSWSTGFIPNEIFPFFNNLYRLLNVQALGIYEVSPPLDLDHRTVKLASQILHQYVDPIQ